MEQIVMTLFVICCIVLVCIVIATVCANLISLYEKLNPRKYKVREENCKFAPMVKHWWADGWAYTSKYNFKEYDTLEEAKQEIKEYEARMHAIDLKDKQEAEARKKAPKIRFHKVRRPLP